MSDAENTEAVLRDVVTALVTTYVKGGGKYAHIAKAQNLTPSTVKRLANQSTNYPRFHTVVAVLDFFGYTLLHSTKSNVVKLRA